jgi:hypothetical protein
MLRNYLDLPLNLSLVVFVWVATIGISALYFYYSGLLMRHLKMHHPNVWADRVQKPFYLGDGGAMFLYFVILGSYKGVSDEELFRLVWILRLLALGCAVGIPASIIVTAAFPDFHLPPPGGYGSLKISNCVTDRLD